MGTILGLSGNFFLNTGVHATPSWEACAFVRNATLQVPQIMADASRRGSGGFKQYEPTLKDVSLEIEAVKDKDDSTFVEFYDHFVAGTTFEGAVVDGPNGTGAYYFTSHWAFENWEETQELEGIVLLSITLRCRPNALLVPGFGDGALPTTRS